MTRDRTGATSSRVRGFLQALPPYLGGKRRLIRHIIKALPRPSVAPVLIDAFLGGGSVSLTAKARGYRVLCNDVALRSAAIGRSFIANDRVTLSRADVARVLAAEPEGNGSHPARGVLPEVHARFVHRALQVALRLGGTKGALLTVLAIRYIMVLRPMGNFGAKAVMTQLAEGRWDEVNETVLRDSFTRRIQSPPQVICDELIPKINAGIFANGLVNEAHQRDVFDFLQDVEGSVVYLDPPYGGTVAYESALRPLDEILAGRHIDPVPSEFSGRRAVESLHHLVEACSHVPHLVLSYGNAILRPDELEALVAKHRIVKDVSVIEYSHLPGVAGDAKKEANREVIVVAGPGRQS